MVIAIRQKTARNLRHLYLLLNLGHVATRLNHVHFGARQHLAQAARPGRVHHRILHPQITQVGWPSCANRGRISYKATARKTAAEARARS